MATMNYLNMKTASMAKDADDKRSENREKAMLLFTFQLLLDKGYVDTAATFSSECSLNLDQYCICENIDLRSIFVDFEAYFNLRFQKLPQYFKKMNRDDGDSMLSKLKGQNRKAGNAKTASIRPNSKTQKSPEMDEGDSVSQEYLTPSVYGLSQSQFQQNGLLSQAGEKLLKPISGLDFLTDDTRMFAEMIQREIVVSSLNTKWGDVIGLESAKTILIESLVYTREFVEFFGQALPPWRALLLYGPPGTGKTLLAKAVATECGTTFFNISTASIVSKWRGDSEKIVKVLFDLARYHAPSTIFFDEFDALGSKRDTLGESDASRRLKSEILQQMDGLLASTHHNNHHQLPVFILAATNLPWELDPAIVRRMEKRIYVPLPNAGERIEMLKLHFERTAQGVRETSQGRNALLCQFNLDILASATDGYSGSDLQQIVKETVIHKFRENFGHKIKKLVLLTEDVMRAIQSVSPTVKAHLSDKFAVWDSSFRAN